METKVKILDLQGRVLQELVTNGQSQLTLDVKGFAKGFYFVRVESNGQTPIAKKFQLI
ncbi:MAG: T9SS type A sorting domain-containing protein [Bacteroidetes bacterium]|nr:T9SS type A sorting domain-containing protein [Bacteroidota bacterium]